MKRLGGLAVSLVFIKRNDPYFDLALLWTIQWDHVMNTTMNYSVSSPRFRLVLSEPGLLTRCLESGKLDGKFEINYLPSGKILHQMSITFFHVWNIMRNIGTLCLVSGMVLFNSLRTPELKSQKIRFFQSPIETSTI